MKSKIKMRDSEAEKHGKKSETHDAKAAGYGPSVHMSSKLYSHSQKHLGKDEAGMGKKPSDGAPHKPVQGPSEGRGTHGGKLHSKVQGPGAMKDSGLHHDGKNEVKHTSHDAFVGGANSKYMEHEGIKDGHRKLEKVPAHEIGGKKYTKDTDHDGE